MDEKRAKQDNNFSESDNNDLVSNQSSRKVSDDLQDVPQPRADSSNARPSEKSSDNLLRQAKENFANREVRAPKRGNKWLSLAYFLGTLLLTFVLMYQLASSATNGNEKTLAEIFSNLRTDYAIAALCIWISMMLLDAMKYFIIIHAVTGKFQLKISLKTGLWGKYYDNITPFSSGGQPFQIHYLHKKGFSGGESTAIICIKFCFNVIMWLSICLCLMVFNRGALFKYVADETQRNFFSVLGWVGFGINCFLPVAILAFAVFPKMTEAVTRWFLQIGHKLRLVKNKDTLILHAKRGVNDFRSSFVLMTRKPLHFVLLLICCVCEPFLGMTLPYFVVVAMGGSAITPSAELMFAIMTLHVYVSMSVAAVPTPGNSGAMESAFVLILTSVAEGVLFWSVLTWRFLSYYTYIIAGMCVFIADFIRRARNKQQ